MNKEFVILWTRIFYSRYCADCFLLWIIEKLVKLDTCPRCGRSNVLKGETYEKDREI